MWTVVYVARNTQESDKIAKALSDNGVLVKLRQIGKKEGTKSVFEILVPQTEVEDASIVLTTLAY